MNTVNKLSLQDKERILRHVDHTVLSPTATWDDIQACLIDTRNLQMASACIPPSFVEMAAAWRKSLPSCQHIKICTVIGFPNGYSTAITKFNEARDAIAKGADELDVVVNLTWVKSGDYDSIRQELEALREVAKRQVLKVIIETSSLTDEEKIKLCEIVSDVGADYIKTSTGFAGGGATIDDVRLLRQHVGPKVLVKASGGIRTFEDAKAMLDAGADRIGSSGLARLMEMDE